MAKNKKPKSYYVVGKLCFGINITDKNNGYSSEHKIEGIDGYLPMFKSKKKAEKDSENGKYIVFKIEETI